jgi:hypothetical protein
MGSVSNGVHTITLREREDGTVLRSMTMTSGTANCWFLPFAPPAEIAPSCNPTTLLSSTVGCAAFTGFTYVAGGDYVVGAMDTGGGGFCTNAGTTNNGADAICGNITWTFQCSVVCAPPPPFTQSTRAVLVRVS